MSLLVTRSALATALSTLGGVTGSEYRPNVIAQGAAWPQVARFDHVEAGALQTTWHLFVVLVPDERAASELMDTLAPDIIDALSGEVFVDSIEPITLQTSGGETFALQITARSE